MSLKKGPVNVPRYEPVEEKECKIIIPKSDVDKLVQVTINGHSVEYNSAEFELLEENCVTSYKGHQYLHYVGQGGLVKNPKGNISAYRMFERDSDFRRYENLPRLKETIDLSQFDTSSITDMCCMFANFDGFTDWVKGIDTFDTSNVETMSCMFSKSDCEGRYYTTLDLRNFNTSKVKNMSQMFESTFLTDIDVSSFDTSNVEDMSGMFAFTNVSELNLRNFNTSKVKDMSQMFDYTRELEELHISHFDLSSIEDGGLFDMFSDSFSEKEYPVLDLTGFNFPPQRPELLDGLFGGVCYAHRVLVSSAMYPMFLKYKERYNFQITVRDNNLDLLESASSIDSSSEEGEVYKHLKSQGYSDKDIVSALHTINSNSKIALNYCDKIVLPKLSKDLMSGDKTVGEVLDVYYDKYPKVLVNEAMCRLLRNHNIV